MILHNRRFNQAKKLRNKLLLKPKRNRWIISIRASKNFVFVQNSHYQKKIRGTKMYSIGRDCSEGGYDFNTEENAKKWRGLFIPALQQIQKSTHPTLIAKQDGLEFVESLILRLLGALISASPTNPSTVGSTSSSTILHNISDVEERIKRLFPTPLDRWTIKKGHETLATLKNHKKSKANIIFSGTDRNPLRTPVDKFHQLLQKEILGHKTDIQVSQYILAALEYIAIDIIQLSGHYVRNIPTYTEITSQDIRVAMCADKVLMDMFYKDVDEVAFGPPPSAGFYYHQSFFDTDPTEYGNVGRSYSESVKELINEERQFIRDLNLIIKVFRDPLTRLLPPSDLEKIFANIDDIYDFSNHFLSSLEDAVEVADEENCPAVGACFEEFAEGQEFDVFEKCAKDVMSFSCREHLYRVLSQPDIISALPHNDNGMLAALRYVLPRLLPVPVYHCFSYFKAIENFKELTKSDEDRESLQQAEGLLSPLKKELENISKGTKGEGYFLRLYGRTNRATALAKMSEIQRSIDGWEGKDIGQSCNEFIMDGTLHKVSGLGIGHRSTRFTERHAFLFDGLIVLCKQNNKRSTMSVTAAVTGRDNSTSSCEWRLKERYLIRNIEIVDREDLCERTSSFYLLPNPLTSVSSSLSSSGHSSAAINNCGGDNASLASFDQSGALPPTSLSSVNNLTNNVETMSLSGGNNFNSDNQSICSMSNISASNQSSGGGGSGGNNNSPAPNLRNAFEISPRNQTHIVLVAKTAEEKDLWMSQLILLNTRSMLERTLDSRLVEEAKKHPLQLPHASCYRFAIEDLDTNIIFEENKSNPNVPLIKGATLMKLIERLTYHKYGDPMLVRTFLTTYRSFCTPSELLKLLIDRFEIPEPDFRSCMQAMHFANDELSSPTSIHPPVSNDSMMVVDGQTATIGDNGEPGSSSNTGPTSPTSPTQYGNLSINSREFSSFFDEQDEQSQKDYREMLKRFRKEYAQPVQFRVMNVIRHWIDNHYYDFERDSQLLLTLNDFLVEKVAACRNMRKLRDHIQKVLERKVAEQTQENVSVPSFYKTPPVLEWHLTQDSKEFNLLTLHPVEIARQLTLLEFELYRAVKPSELVGTEGQTGVWTKKDKKKTSPNLLKMIRHTSNFTFYLEKCIIEAENFEERVAIMMRIIEIMMVFQDLNNFNGILEVTSALAAACVHRLDHTMSVVEKNSKLKKALDEAKELNLDHFKKYHEKLRSINPPCVPFFGMYLTNILHIEEGNPEYLSPPNMENVSLHESNLMSIENDSANCKLINFSKKRKVAEITNEIQQYQNQPYCLSTEAKIRQFLENLDPLGSMDENEFNDYLYNKSKEIEPRGSKQPSKAPRRWPYLNLKSPGLKTQGSRSRFVNIPPLPLIDPRISNFVTGGGSCSHNSTNHQQNSQNNNGSAPNSATGHSANADNLDNISLAQQMSPSTPLTPPQFASFGSSLSHHHHNSFSSSANDPVFANVFIGGGGNSAPGVSPSTPVHLSSPSSTQFFPNSMQHPPQSLPPPPPLPSQVSSPSHPFSSLTTTDFHLKPPPLPPRTYRQKQSPRSRYQPPLPPFSGRDEDDSSPTSPPPLPPRSSHTPTLSRSISTQGYRDLAPPPLPPLPHPSSSSSHHHFFNHSPNQFIHHQRVNSDNILSSGSSGTAFNCTSNGPSSHNGSPIVRRNSSKEPLPPRRFSQGGQPLSPFPISPNSPSSSTVVCHSPLSQHCPSSPPAVPVQTPPAMTTVASSPISLSAVAAASTVVSSSSTASSPVPELPPKTYRLSNVCR